MDNKSTSGLSIEQMRALVNNLPGGKKGRPRKNSGTRGRKVDISLLEADMKYSAFINGMIYPLNADNVKCYCYESKTGIFNEKLYKKFVYGKISFMNFPAVKVIIFKSEMYSFEHFYRESEDKQRFAEAVNFTLVSVLSHFKQSKSILSSQKVEIDNDVLNDITVDVVGKSFSSLKSLERFISKSLLELTNVKTVLHELNNITLEHTVLEFLNQSRIGRLMF